MKKIITGILIVLILFLVCITVLFKTNNNKLIKENTSLKTELINKNKVKSAENIIFSPSKKWYVRVPYGWEKENEFEGGINLIKKNLSQNEKNYRLYIIHYYLEDKKYSSLFEKIDKQNDNTYSFKSQEQIV